MPFRHGRDLAGALALALALSAEAPGQLVFEGPAPPLAVPVAAPVAAPIPTPEVAPELVRPLEGLRELRLGTYNVLNLFEHVGRHVPTPDGGMRRETDPYKKTQDQFRGTAKAILDTRLDVVVLQEVENAAALEAFNRDWLGGRYRVFLIEGNDPRGIDVGFLVAKDLAIEVEARSHKDETWFDPVLGRRERVFSRDLPALLLREPGRAEPLLALFGTHMKSLRTRDPRDPQSRTLRLEQGRRTAEILSRYRKEFGPGLPILVAGDFNGDIASDPAVAAVRSGGVSDTFDMQSKRLPAAKRVTHTYHPHDGPTEAKQVDAVLADESLRPAVLGSKVYRYRGEDGRIKPIPTTIEERNRNPSDHFPVVLRLDPRRLLRREPAPSAGPSSRLGRLGLAFGQEEAAKPWEAVAAWLRGALARPGR